MLISLNDILRGVIKVMTYKYRCDECGPFEADQKISEDPLSVCPACKSSCERVPFTGADANGAFAISGYTYKNGYS